MKNKLRKDGFNETSSNVYNKKVENTSYTFDIRKKQFSKTIINQDSSFQENIILNIKNNNTTAYYDYKDNSGCRITQKGTYTNSDYKCNIEYNTANCKSRCDKMLEEIKNFNNEYNKVIK